MRQGLIKRYESLNDLQRKFFVSRLLAHFGAVQRGTKPGGMTRFLSIWSKSAKRELLGYAAYCGDIDEVLDRAEILFYSQASAQDLDFNHDWLSGQFAKLVGGLMAGVAK